MGKGSGSDAQIAAYVDPPTLTDEMEDDAFAPRAQYPGENPIPRRWVRTRHGWSKECEACGSTNFGRPCRETEDGFHV